MYLSGQTCALKSSALGACAVVRTSKWWVRITPAFATQLEVERQLYAVRPSKAEVITQLVQEGLVFRRMHRPPPPRKRRKRMPLPPELIAATKI
jgi:hypothetical protein